MEMVNADKTQYPDKLAALKQELSSSTLLVGDRFTIIRRHIDNVSNMNGAHGKQIAGEFKEIFTQLENLGLMPTATPAWTATQLSEDNLSGLDYHQAGDKPIYGSIRIPGMVASGLDTPSTQDFEQAQHKLQETLSTVLSLVELIESTFTHNTYEPAGDNLLRLSAEIKVVLTNHDTQSSTLRSKAGLFGGDVPWPEPTGRTDSNTVSNEEESNQLANAQHKLIAAGNA